MKQLNPPRRLRHSDKRDGFHCGVAELDQWLMQYAWQNQRANNAVTYVITQTVRGADNQTEEEVVGYYALANTYIAAMSAPPSIGRHRPRQIPAVLLARLATDSSAQGYGIESALLQHAFRQVRAISELTGVAAVRVDCIDETAKQFYLHHGPFLEMPGQPLTLILPTSALR